MFYSAIYWLSGTDYSRLLVVRRRFDSVPSKTIDSEWPVDGECRLALSYRVAPRDGYKTLKSIGVLLGKSEADKKYPRKYPQL